jgi:uncharacterized protein YjbI with pentapeptide repeats
VLGSGAILVLIAVAYVGGWRWTGLPAGSQSAQGAKTLWDWLQLLIVPAVLAAGGLLFNAQQSARQDRATEAQEQEATLVAYLDHMSDLLLAHELRSVDADGVVRQVARAHTLTALRRLDGGRRSAIVVFLYQAQLILGKVPIVPLHSANLSKVNLSGADLPGANLSKADLSGAILCWAKLPEALLSGAVMPGADLSEAVMPEAVLPGAVLRGAKLCRTDLSGADLSGAVMPGADLRGVVLHGAVLPDADLRGANLSGANLREAVLRGAKLSGADLSEADLSEADLSEADLSLADLRGAAITDEQLGTVRSLKGAMMPDGTAHV